MSYDVMHQLTNTCRLGQCVRSPFFAVGPWRPRLLFAGGVQRSQLSQEALVLLLQGLDLQLELRDLPLRVVGQLGLLASGTTKTTTGVRTRQEVGTCNTEPTDLLTCRQYSISF